MGVFLKRMYGIMTAVQVGQIAMGGLNFIAKTYPDVIDNLPLFNDTIQERSEDEMNLEFRNPPDSNATFLRNAPDPNATYITTGFQNEQKPSDIVKGLYKDFSRQTDGSDALDYANRGVDDRSFEDVIKENNEVMSLAANSPNLTTGPDPDQNLRIRKNIAESQEAREASNYGKEGLDYNKHELSSRNFDRLMKERGIPEDTAREIKESHNRWSPYRNDDLPTDTFAKHADPEGEDLIIYSSLGNDASGNYLSKEIYNDNANGIHDLALPAGDLDYHGNDMLHADRVKAKGDLIGGTVAPQPNFTIDASTDKSDSIERAGGGEQYITNGGFKSGVVEKTGESWSLADTAGRRKLLNPTIDSEDSDGNSEKPVFYKNVQNNDNINGNTNVGGSNNSEDNTKLKEAPKSENTEKSKETPEADNKVETKEAPELGNGNAENNQKDKGTSDKGNDKDAEAAKWDNYYGIG